METRKERPILMNTEMVKAILEGRKTQTRRPIKGNPNFVRWCPLQPGNRYDGWEDEHGRPLPCPFGTVGDRLWVRETWKLRYIGDLVEKNGCVCQINYSTGISEDVHVYGDDCYSLAFNKQDIWRPSIFMPRWASRITLEVVNVRVERVHEISEDDAKAEGVQPINLEAVAGKGYQFGFRDIWFDIYGIENWETNPWVWVVEFKVVE